MLSYISAKEASEKWNISQRRVSVLCSENRVEGAMMVGKMWIIPKDAEKPVDKRTLNCECRQVNVKPFVKWVGGKSQLIPELQKFISSKTKTYRKYCEPMVGGGALLFALVPQYSFEQIYISDINAELINAYSVVKTDVENLIAELTKMQVDFLSMDDKGRKSYYYFSRDKFNAEILNSGNCVEKAALFIFLNKTCFNGLYRVNKKGQFNVPMGAYKNPTICDSENLRNVSTILQKVQIVHGDYTLSEDFVDQDTFVYIDPPYRPISQTSGFTSYNADSFGDDEQIRLAEYIKELDKKGAKIVLSNSDPKNNDEDDNFFDELYKSYSICRVSATRMINSKANSRGAINELIISN